MTYGPNNFRSNGGIFIGGGSNNVVIRHNTFSNIMPYDNGYNAAGKNYNEQYDPDGDTARAAIWFYGGSNYSIDHNTFLHDLPEHQGCQGQQFQAQNILDPPQFLRLSSSDVHGDQYRGMDAAIPPTTRESPTFRSTTTTISMPAALTPRPIHSASPRRLPRRNNQAALSTQPIPMSGVVWYNNLLKGVVNNNEYVGHRPRSRRPGHEDLQQHDHVSVADSGIRIWRHGRRVHAGQLRLPHHPVAG